MLACGTPGGDQQDQWQSLFLLRHLVGGMTLQEAIDAPMFHTTSFPGSFDPREMEPGVLVVEDRIDAAVLAGAALRAATRWCPRAPGRWAGMCAVTRDPATGVLAAGREPARHAGVRRRAASACGRSAATAA